MVRVFDASMGIPSLIVYAKLARDLYEESKADGGKACAFHPHVDHR